jgi:hypothetical protein
MRVVVGQYEGIDATPVLPLAAGVLVATVRADPELGPAPTSRIALVRQRRSTPRSTSYAARRARASSLYPWNAAYALAVAAAARAAYPARADRRRRTVGAAPAATRPGASWPRTRRSTCWCFAEGEVAFRELVRAHRAARDARTSPASRCAGSTARTW